MHPPPSLEVFFHLMEVPIELISFGSYVVDLSFENGNRLTIHAPFRFSSRDSFREAPIQEIPLRETALVRLIGHQIVECECEESGTLDLLFSNDDRLIVYANDPRCEAYTLEVDGEEYEV